MMIDEELVLLLSLKSGAMYKWIRIIMINVGTIHAAVSPYF